MSRVGIEVTPQTLRAVVLRRFGSGVSRTAEVPWDPESPDEGIAALRARCGSTDSIALAIGLGFTSVVRVDLPPAPQDAREHIVSLEPERFFASSDPLDTALAPGTDLAFGVSKALSSRWIDAFSAWAPVTRVDAAPVALARALPEESGGRADDARDPQAGVTTYAVDAGLHERGLVTVRGRQLVAARRVADDATLDTSLTPLPGRPGVEPRFLSALGAVLGEDASQLGTLWPEDRRRSARRMAARQTTVALLAAVAALVLAGAAFDRWRERTLVALEVEAQRLTSEAAPALASQQRLQLLAREDEIMRQVAAQRANPAAALAAIGLALPSDAIVTTARANGASWQIDGTARTVAPLVPQLDRSGTFDNVRSLSASSRFLDGNRSRETFSLAFDVRPRS